MCAVHALLWSSGAPASSSRVYLMKSAFRTRIKMVARKPVNSSTVTQELTMLNQWICMAGHEHEFQPLSVTHQQSFMHATCLTACQQSFMHETRECMDAVQDVLGSIASTHFDSPWFITADM